MANWSYCEMEFLEDINRLRLCQLSTTFPGLHVSEGEFYSYEVGIASLSLKTRIHVYSNNG